MEPALPALAIDAPEIFYVIGTLDIGGTEKHLVAIATMLVQRGWKVSVYALAGAGPLRSELERGGVTVLLSPMPARKSSSAPRRILRFLRSTLNLFLVMLKRRPAIVHFFLPMAYLTGAPLALLSRIPIRVMSRRSLNLYQSEHWWISVVEKALHSTMMAILGNSRSVVDQIKNLEGVPVRSLGLIYNGVDLARFSGCNPRAAMRAALGLAPDSLVLVIVANLIPYKGHRDLINALGQARPHLPAAWQLLIVGRDDGIGADLQRQTVECGIANEVSFLGPRNDVPEILRACDIGLLCSHEEGFSNAILEGMAAGLPMIVTDVGGNPEAVLDGETGIVVPSRDPQRLSNAIVLLAKNASQRADFGAAARRRVVDNFSLDYCVSCYDDLYRTLLAGGIPQDTMRVRVPD